MKIHFERSGGFMGKSIHATVDTSTLPDPEAEALEEMLSEATFFALPAADEAEPQAPGIDQMTSVSYTHLTLPTN